MKSSLRIDDFTPATIAVATFWGLVAALALLPADSRGQDAEGIQRLLLRIQQMDAEHNPSPCATASRLRSEALSSASSSRVLAPRPGNENDISSPPALTSKSVDQAPAIFGVLNPVIAPEAFEPEPNLATQFGGSRNRFPQEPDSFSTPTPVKLVSSSTSTRPLTVSKASRLWKTYCNQDDVVPPASGNEQGCPCRGN